MRIGELSRRTGASVRSLRYYEEQGLLLSGRTAGGQREYTESAVDRVTRIRALLQAGMNSAAIYRILPCIRDVDGGPSDIADEQLSADLATERARILRQINALQESLRSLDSVIATATLPEAQ